MLGLRSDGQVTGCLALPANSAVGNLRQVSLARLARQAADARERRLAHLAGACRDCRHVARCQGGCHATALAARGVLDNPYCVARGVQRPGTHRSGAARATAGIVLAAALGAGCGPKEDPRTAPTQRTAPTGTADAGAAAPDAQPPPDAAAPRPEPPKKRAAVKPALRISPFHHSRCMTSHVGCFHLRRFRKQPRKQPKQRP